MSDDEKDQYNEEAYEEYLQDRLFDLWEEEERYNNKPSYLKLFHIWIGYREIKETPPETILLAMDKYAKIIIKKEQRARVKSTGHKMSVRDFVDISKSKPLKPALEKYAKKMSLTFDTARKQFEVAKKKWGGIFTKKIR